MKFGRIYQLTVEVAAGEAIAISYPLTLQFDVCRNTLASANTGHFRLLNLKPDTRKRLFFDRDQTFNYRRIKVQAGYQDQSPLPEIFIGNLLSAYSYRQGTDWVTEIEAFDGGYGILNGQVNGSRPAGWSIRQVIIDALGTMKNVSAGSVGALAGENSRGVTLMGNSWSFINTLASGQDASAFIDGEVGNVITRNEYIGNAPALTLINDETGLLQTPRRFNALLEVTTLFEPRLKVGQRVQLESLETVYNGAYKVQGIAHRGTISGAVGGECVTVASLDLGTSVLKAVA